MKLIKLVDFMVFLSCLLVLCFWKIAIKFLYCSVLVTTSAGDIMWLVFGSIYAALREQRRQKGNQLYCEVKFQSTLLYASSDITLEEARNLVSVSIHATLREQRQQFSPTFPYYITLFLLILYISHIIFLIFLPYISPISPIFPVRISRQFHVRSPFAPPLLSIYRHLIMPKPNRRTLPHMRIPPRLQKSRK